VTGASTIIEEIEARGGIIRRDGDSLCIRQPAGGLPPELVTKVAANKTAVMAAISRAQREAFEWRLRLEWTIDPRAGDLPEDCDAWTWLLDRVYAENGGPPDPLLGGLHFIRCLGARLERDAGGVRIVTGECPAEEYDTIRRNVLIPHAALLRQLLAAIPPDSGKDGQGPARISRPVSVVSPNTSATGPRKPMP
jgi:hypothetical protein